MLTRSMMFLTLMFAVGRANAGNVDENSTMPAVADDVADAPMEAVAMATTSGAAKVTDHIKTINVEDPDNKATITWRDYGNGYTQLKSGDCSSGGKYSTCEFILRADGGNTTFAQWGPATPDFAGFVNGKYTIAKSRHPYVKIIIKWAALGTFTGYVHLY